MYGLKSIRLQTFELKYPRQGGFLSWPMVTSINYIQKNLLLQNYFWRIKYFKIYLNIQDMKNKT